MRSPSTSADMATANGSPDGAYAFSDFGADAAVVARQIARERGRGRSRSAPRSAASPRCSPSARPGGRPSPGSSSSTSSRRWIRAASSTSRASCGREPSRASPPSRRRRRRSRPISRTGRGRPRSTVSRRTCGTIRTALALALGPALPRRAALGQCRLGRGRGALDGRRRPSAGADAPRARRVERARHAGGGAGVRRGSHRAPRTWTWGAPGTWWPAIATTSSQARSSPSWTAASTR